SQGLGAVGPTSATLVEDGAALELQIDNKPDSITGTTNTLLISEVLSIQGLGLGGTGALHSISGINTWAGTIALSSLTAAGGTDAIGVEPDPSPNPDETYFTNDWSLTVTGNISGLQTISLAKVGTGHMILPNANTYLGPTQILLGWVTILNNQSL